MLKYIVPTGMMPCPTHSLTHPPIASVSSRPSHKLFTVMWSYCPRSCWTAFDFSYSILFPSRYTGVRFHSTSLRAHSLRTSMQNAPFVLPSIARLYGTVWRTRNGIAALLRRQWRQYNTGGLHCSTAVSAEGNPLSKLQPWWWLMVRACGLRQLALPNVCMCTHTLLSLALQDAGFSRFLGVASL